MSPRGPILQERVLPAPPEQVFDTWSDASSLGIWMCPTGVKGARAEVDFRVGGRFRIVMQGEEQEYAQHGEYLEIDRPHRLVFTWNSEWMPDEVAHTRVILTLEPAGEGQTRLRLRHEIPDTDAYDGHVGGWGAILTHLTSHLEDSP